MRENQENTIKFKKDRYKKMMVNHNKFSMHTFILWKRKKNKMQQVKKRNIRKKWILHFLLISNKL